MFHCSDYLILQNSKKTRTKYGLRIFRSVLLRCNVNASWPMEKQKPFHDLCGYYCRLCVVIVVSNCLRSTIKRSKFKNFQGEHAPRSPIQCCSVHVQSTTHYAHSTLHSVLRFLQCQDPPINCISLLKLSLHLGIHTWISTPHGTWKRITQCKKIYILLHPCILGNRGGSKVINPSHKPLFMYFLINIYKITCIQYTCIHRSNIITQYSS